MHKIDAHLIFSPYKKNTRENRLMKQTREAVRCAIFVSLFSNTYLKQASRADKLAPEQLLVVRSGFVAESALRSGSAQKAERVGLV